MAKEKRELPTWAVVTSVVVVVGFVVALFAKGANGGDASKDELMMIRNNQRSFASSSAPSNTPGGPANTPGRGNMPLGGPGAPPGAVIDPSAGRG